MKEYNQLSQKDTNYACSIYALLNLFKYDYGVVVPLNTILKFLIYLEKVGAFIRLEGAYASVIYPVAVKYINFKYGLKLKLGIVGFHNNMSDKHGWIIGYKRANTSYIQTTQDGLVDKDDIDLVAKTKQNGHFHYYKRGRIVESAGGFRYKMSKEVLKYAFDKGLYYTNVRWVYGEEELQKELIKIVKFRKMQKLKEPFVSINQILEIKKSLENKNNN